MDRAYFVACQSKAEATADAVIDRCDRAAEKGAADRLLNPGNAKTPGSRPTPLIVDPIMSAGPTVAVSLIALERVTQIASEQFRPGATWSPEDYAALAELRGKALEGRRLIEGWPSHFRIRGKGKTLVPVSALS